MRMPVRRELPSKNVLSRCAVLAAFILCVAGVADAADLWVLNGSVIVQCGVLTWEADTLFFNGGAQPATIRLLGVSDGPDAVANREYTLQPGDIISSAVMLAGWRPASYANLYFVHLDVPASVTAEGVLNVGRDPCTLTPAPNNRGLYGSARLSTFRSLTTAGQRTTYLGVDLGMLASRTNVGVYNAGSSTATATIEMRRAWDNEVLATTVVQVPANTTMQVPLGALPFRGGIDHGVQAWVNYVNVTVDQPSLTFISTLRNDVNPGVSLVTQ